MDSEGGVDIWIRIEGYMRNHSPSPATQMFGLRELLNPDLAFRRLGAQICIWLACRICA